MSNSDNHSGHTDAGAAQAVSHLGESLAQSAESQRALVQEITLFTKDESLRFVNLRLERNGAALDKLQNCHGVPGLINVQQEWLRDFLQDYTSQSMRVMGALRGLTKNVVETAVGNASDNIDRMQQGASEAVHQGEEVIQHAQDIGHRALRQADEQISNIPQDLNNNYVQH